MIIMNLTITPFLYLLLFCGFGGFVVGSLIFFTRPKIIGNVADGDTNDRRRISKHRKRNGLTISKIANTGSINSEQDLESDSSINLHQRDEISELAFISAKLCFTLVNHDTDCKATIIRLPIIVRDLLTDYTLPCAWHYVFALIYRYTTNRDARPQLMVHALSQIVADLKRYSPSNCGPMNSDDERILSYSHPILHQHVNNGNNLKQPLIKIICEEIQKHVIDRRQPHDHAVIDAALRGLCWSHSGVVAPNRSSFARLYEQFVLPTKDPTNAASAFHTDLAQVTATLLSRPPLEMPQTVIDKLDRIR